MSLHAEWVEDGDLDYKELERRWRAVQGHPASMNSLAEEIHRTNEAHGFHEPFSNEVLRNAYRYMSHVAPQLEDFEAYRKGRIAQRSRYTWDSLSDDQREALVRLLLIMTEVHETLVAAWEDPEHEAEEVADCIIRLFDYARLREIDIDKSVRTKMEFNKTRPFKHGKKF